MVARVPVVYADSETKIWADSADYVVFSGNYDKFDVELLRNGSSREWIVKNNDGVTYQIVEATSLKLTTRSFLALAYISSRKQAPSSSAGLEQHWHW